MAPRRAHSRSRPTISSAAVSWSEGRAAEKRASSPLAAADPKAKDSTKALASIVKRLTRRWFLVHDVHAGHEPFLLQPRWTMSFLHSPLVGVAKLVQPAGTSFRVSRSASPSPAALDEEQGACRPSARLASIHPKTRSRGVS